MGEVTIGPKPDGESEEPAARKGRLGSIPFEPELGYRYVYRHDRTGTSVAMSVVFCLTVCPIGMPVPVPVQLMSWEKNIQEKVSAREPFPLVKPPRFPLVGRRRDLGDTASP